MKFFNGGSSVSMASMSSCHARRGESKGAREGEASHAATHELGLNELGLGLVSRCRCPEAMPGEGEGRARGLKGEDAGVIPFGPLNLPLR